MIDKILKEKIALAKEFEAAHNPAPPVATSRKNRPHSDLVLLELFTLITAICTQLPFFSSHLLILGAPFLMFIPGYSLLSALFPRKEELGGVERVSLSLALSLLISLILAFLLHQYLQWEGQVNPILVVLMFISLVSCFLAYHKRQEQPADQRFQLQIPTPGEGRTLSYLLVLVLVVAAITTLYLALTPAPTDKSTEFYILGPEGQATYNTQLIIGQKSDLKIGIVNHEQNQTTYRLVVLVDGESLLNETLTLSDGQRLETPFTYTPTSNGTQEMELLLYKFPSDQTVPYRSLRLWYQIG